jgi:hypothetical protein
MFFRSFITLISATILAGIAVYSTHANVNVSIVTDEADAVLNILNKRAANKRSSQRDWQRLVNSEGYRRLKQREESLGREFTDEAFTKVSLFT